MYINQKKKDYCMILGKVIDIDNKTDRFIKIVAM